MYIHKDNYFTINKLLTEKDVKLIAVSKTKTLEAIQELYEIGQRDFGENYVQELVDKQAQLPNDIQWHFIGHLQSNKVKYIAPFVHLIHGVDSENLLKEINKQAIKNNRIINCLLQIHIAKEETKFGLNETELFEILNNTVPNLTNVNVCGLMGMASFSDDKKLVQNEFNYLNTLFQKAKSQNPNFTILSSGMSADYYIAIENGSNMVRIGSLLFGKRL